MSATLLRPDVRALAAEVAGPVLLPGDDGYAAECATFNLGHSLEPAVAVGATSVADVQAAVRFAAARGMPVAVKAAGHQTACPAHGALLICTGRMSRVAVDAATRTARIEAGVRWRQVIDEGARVGLAPMNGSSSRVGVIGYLLGGGHSVAWSRAMGYAADHVASFDVVTADGQLRRVTAASEPDLSWALRGGKSNFGVVTAVDVALFPQARIYGGGIWFPLEHLAAVVHAWRAWVETLPEEATSSFAVQRLPPLPFLPAPLRGASVVHVRFCHLGPAAEGERLIGPMRAVAPVVLDSLADMPYAAMDAVHVDPPDPLPYSEAATTLRELPAEAVDALVALTGPRSGCPLVSVEVRHLGGAMDREPAVPSAVPTRGIPFVLFSFGAGGPAERAPMVAYLDKLMRGMQPWAAARQFINFMRGAQGTTVDEVRAAYGPERYERLARIKRTYDPLNVFRASLDILPA
jgi:FAD/FMN-containing dehydrogenase